jgi:hypothetical protein
VPAKNIRVKTDVYLVSPQLVRRPMRLPALREPTPADRSRLPDTRKGSIEMKPSPTSPQRCDRRHAVKAEITHPPLPRVGAGDSGPVFRYVPPACIVGTAS